MDVVLTTFITVCLDDYIGKDDLILTTYPTRLSANALPDNCKSLFMNVAAPILIIWAALASVSSTDSQDMISTESGEIKILVSRKNCE